MPNIEERVKTTISEHLGVDIAKIANTDSFTDDLGADSLDKVELIMAFEEDFDIKEITDEQAGKINTVAEAVAFVKAATGLK